MQKDVIYNVCSNPECKYSDGFKRNNSWRPGICPLCGAEVWYLCPHCKKEEFRYKNPRFCTDRECAAEIKPAPQKKKKCKEKVE